MSEDLRRVLKDPAHRLPNSLVDLDAVHAGVRRVQRRRTGLAALGGAAVVVALAAVVVHPWPGSDGSLPTASTGPTPSVVARPTADSTPPVSPTPSPDSSGVVAAVHVVGVSAVSTSTWWVLSTLGSCPDACETRLMQTLDDGRSFVQTSSSREIRGIPAGTTTVRFLADSPDANGYALVPTNPVGQQLFATFDGGTTWNATKPTPRALALEAGGGIAWLLVQEGTKVGVIPLVGGGAGFMGPGPEWLGTGNGVAPALIVERGQAVVLWFSGSLSRTSLVSVNGTVVQRVNPCTPDLGVGSVSASEGGLAVTCHTGTADGAELSADGGQTWSALGTRGDSGRLTIGSISGTRAALGRDQTITLVGLPLGSGSGSRDATVTGNIGAWTWIGFTSPASGFAIDSAGQLFRTTDGGSTWARTTFAGP